MVKATIYENGIRVAWGNLAIMRDIHRRRALAGRNVVLVIGNE